MFKLIVVISSLFLICCRAASYGYGGGISNVIVNAAIQTKGRVDYKVVHIPYESIQPQEIVVPESITPVVIHFLSSSSKVSVKQKHIGSPGETKHTQSEDEPHHLSHVVTKPVIQEIREVITPYRYIIQEIKPVQEDIQTIVAKGEHRGGYGGAVRGGGGYGGAVGGGEVYGGAVSSGGGGYGGAVGGGGGYGGAVGGGEVYGGAVSSGGGGGYGGAVGGGGGYGGAVGGGEVYGGAVSSGGGGYGGAVGGGEVYGGAVSGGGGAVGGGEVYGGAIGGYGSTVGGGEGYGGTIGGSGYGGSVSDGGYRGAVGGGSYGNAYEGDLDTGEVVNGYNGIGGYLFELYSEKTPSKLASLGSMGYMTWPLVDKKLI